MFQGFRILNASLIGLPSAKYSNPLICSFGCEPDALCPIYLLNSKSLVYTTGESVSSIPTPTLI